MRRQTRKLMRGAALQGFIEGHGGVTEALPLPQDAAIRAHWAFQDDAVFDSPAMDSHFLEFSVEGAARGTARIDGMLTSPNVDALPGLVSFVPAGRDGRIDIHGTGLFLQVTLDAEMMESTARDLLRRGGEGSDLLGFNTLMVPEVTPLFRTLQVDPPRDRLAADALAQKFCTALVSNFSTGALASPPAEPTLSTAQMMRAVDLIEACLGLDLSLGRLAEALELPTWYFVAAFESATGIAPSDYLQERRVDRAREWLAEEAERPEEERLDLDVIARFCGLGDRAGMDAAFRRCVGTDASGRPVRRQ
ncbi:MAG: AraC family transcriptional regulator [Pseudomonadota bacterium]